MLSKEDRLFLLKKARTAISREFGIEVKSSPNRKVGKGGIFVTLTKDGELRGCIGFLESGLDLSESVEETAKSAAFGDPRFLPLTKAELNSIKIEISILSNPEPIKKEAIKIGIHGLIIEYNNQSGLLLPQVALEHNLSREEFLEILCEKAGLPHGTWKKKEAKLLGFKDQVFSE